MPLYLGDALDFLFGKKDTDAKKDMKKTTDFLKSAGWEFVKFEESLRTIYFRKGPWGLQIQA
jgi:hypothetical protein